MKFSFKLLLLGLLVAIMAVPGVYATWSYGYDDIQDKELSSNVQLNDFNYFYEIAITNITTVYSNVSYQNSYDVQPTSLKSEINGSAGQKIIYKIDAHNYSNTESFVYAGADYDSVNYGSFNNISISVSLDEQGSNLINSNLSAKAYSTPIIAPGEDFVFYITYTLTGYVSSNNLLVNYTFKPVIYSVTYLNNNQIFAVEHITDNGSAYSVISQKPTQAGASFAGWVNANAVVVSSIPAGNIYDYNLSASWDKVYLIIFADAQGNVLYEEQFTSSSTSLSKQGQETVNQILAELNAEAQQDHMSVSWSEYSISGAKENITVKALYAYNGVLNLVPVYEQPDDGIVDYYKIQAVNTLPETVTVPGSVGGVPIKVVERIANEEGDNDWNNYAEDLKTIIIEEGVERLEWNSLAYTPNLSTVKLPSTINYIAKNAFSRNDLFGNDKKKLTIEFNGTKAQWKAILNNSDSSWAGGLQDGSVVKCSDGYFELDKGLFSSSWKEKNY